MNIVETSSTVEFVETATKWLTGAIITAQEQSEKILLGLSGGGTPAPIYAKLAVEREIRWQNVVCFLVDERYAPPDSEHSNRRMIDQTLFSNAARDTKTIFPDTTVPLPECVEMYSQALHGMKPDVVVLGMGEDGHIASLFPPVGPEAFGPARAIHTTTDAFAVHDRISVTLPVLLGASQRLFLITGEKKKALLKKMRETNEDVSVYPAQYLFDERTTWIVGP